MVELYGRDATGSDNKFCGALILNMFNIIICLNIVKTLNIIIGNDPCDDDVFICLLLSRKQVA